MMSNMIVIIYFVRKIMSRLIVGKGKSIGTFMTLKLLMCKDIRIHAILNSIHILKHYYEKSYQYIIHRKQTKNLNCDSIVDVRYICYISNRDWTYKPTKSRTIYIKYIHLLYLLSPHTFQPP